MEPVYKTSGSVSARGRTGQSPTTALNDCLGVALVAIVAISTIPFASNRPFFWGFWAFTVCTTNLVYVSLIYWRGLRFRQSLTQIPVCAALFAFVFAWMLLQLVPFGQFVGGIAFDTQTGDTIRSETLSIAPGETFLALLKWCSYGLFFYLFLQVAASKRRARNISWALLVIVTAQALYAFVALRYLNDTALISEKAQYQGNATGTFINRNSFATFLAFGATLAASLAMPSSIRREHQDSNGRNAEILGAFNYAALLCLVVLVSALIATSSRMGTLAGLSGVLLVILLRLPSRTSRLSVTFLSLFAIIAILAVYGDDLFNRVLLSVGNAETRLNLYAQVVEMIRSRPMLGFGAGTFGTAYPLHQAPPVQTDLVFDKTHSTYLAHWVELGLIAGSLPIAIVAALVLNMLRYLAKSGVRSAELCAGIGTVVVAALHSVVDFSLEIQAVVFLFLAITALATSEAIGKRQHSDAY